MRQLTYASTSDDPDVGGTAPIRFATVTLNDGGNTGTGGPLAASQSGVVNITAVNDAPVASGSATLAAILEDTAAPSGATVSALVSGNYSDAADGSRPP